MLAPLAVSEQTVDEAARFGVEIEYARKDTGARILITNYEMMNHFDPGEFIGIVIDESGILKSFEGSTRNALIDSYSDTPYRLACTATPAPNDFAELGNHSEFLGLKSRTEMLAEYFVHDGGSTQDWRLKGHATDAFWRWVVSWGALVKKPSDLGYSDDGFILPPLTMKEHIVEADHAKANIDGFLFAPQAMTLNEQRAVRRSTMRQRIDIATKLTANDEPVLIWAELNAEADAITAAIPGAIQIAGSDKIDDKRDRLLGFATGKYRVLVSKTSIAGHGLNFQRCATMIFLGVSHSYEGTYQAIRRCWRFGQKRPVTVHMIRAENESAIVENYRRKEADAQKLADEMGDRLKDAMRAEIRGLRREWNKYDATKAMEVPAWLR